MYIYTTLFYFFIYAFLGWCLEVIYTFVRKKEWINRGFLNGPLCPIYGVGVVLILVFVEWIMRSIGVDGLFETVFVITIITTVLELMTGSLLESLFMTKWWDYSANRFNYKGYICLKFSLAWGLVGAFVIKGLHPFISRGVLTISKNVSQAVLTVLLFIVLIDMLFTIKALIDFRRLLFEFEKITDEYKKC